VGYGLAKHKYGNQHAASSNEAEGSKSAEVAESKPQYGGSEEFKRAIEELRAILPEQVSTDVDDVDGHGHSPSIPHDGA